MSVCECVCVWMPICCLAFFSLGMMAHTLDLHYLHPTPRYSTWAGLGWAGGRTSKPAPLSRRPFHKSRSPTVPGCKRPSQCPTPPPPPLRVVVPSLSLAPSYPQLCIHASRTILPCPSNPSRLTPQLPNLWVPNPGREVSFVPCARCDRGRRHSCTRRHRIRPSVPAQKPQSIGIFLRPVPSADAHTCGGAKKGDK